MTLARVSLTISGLLFLSLGIAFLATPESMAQMARLPIESPASIIEIRAMYGGLEAGLGAFFLISCFRPRWLRAALGAQFMIFAGLAAGRTLGLVQSPVKSRLEMAYAALELVWAVVGLIGFERVKTILLNSRTPV